MLVKQLNRHIPKALYIIVAAFVVFVWSGMIWAPNTGEAAVRKRLNYQGKLLNSSQIPVDDSTYSITFRIYNVATGGGALWADTFDVDTQNGLFSILLGSSGTLDLNFEDESAYYLGVEVQGDGEMTPRKEIGAAAYAINSDMLDGLHATTTGAITSAVAAYDSNGNLTITGDPQGGAVSQGSVYINPAAPAANETLLGIANNGTQRFLLDAEGDLTVAGFVSTTQLFVDSIDIQSSASRTTSGAYIVGVDPTNISQSASTNVQFVLEDLDAAISGVSGSKWTDAGTWIYPTDAGDYYDTGFRIYDNGEINTDANLVVDGYAAIGTATNTNSMLRISQIGAAASNYGIYAIASGAGTNNYGLYASSTGSTNNYGVYGVGSTAGLYGVLSQDVNTYGRIGYQVGATRYGGYFRAGTSTDTDSRFGVLTSAYGSSSDIHGLYSNAYGYGTGAVYGVRSIAYGQTGNQATIQGVFGNASGVVYLPGSSAYGGYFSSGATASTTYGVYGQASLGTSNSYGVYGRGSTGGLYGIDNEDTSSYGRIGVNAVGASINSGTSTRDDDRYGVYATVYGRNGTKYGINSVVQGYGTGISYGAYIDAYAQAANTANIFSVYGIARGTIYSPNKNAYAGYFTTTANATSTYALYALNTSGTVINKYGIYSNVTGGTNNWAGWFAGGDVYVTNKLFVSSSELYIGTDTYLSETTDRLDSGAYFVGVDPTNISQSASTNVQFVLEDLSSAIAGAGLWTESTYFTYLTSTTSDIVLGSNTPANAPFYVDVSAPANDGILQIYGNTANGRGIQVDYEATGGGGTSATAFRGSASSTVQSYVFYGENKSYNVGVTGTAYGGYITFTGGNNTGDYRGYYANVQGGATNYGGYLNVDDSSATTNYGLYTYVRNAPTNYGQYSYVSGVAGGTNYGFYSDVSGINSGSQAYGIWARGQNNTTNYGGYFQGTTTAADTSYGVYSAGSTSGGTSYGVYAQAANGFGFGTAYGIYSMAVGGATNWAAWFANGNVYVDNNLYVSSSALYIGTNTYLSESTARTDSGAYYVGINPTNILQSTSTNVQFVMEDISSVLDEVSGSAGIWSMNTTNIYPTSSTANIYFAPANWFGLGVANPEKNFHVSGTSFMFGDLYIGSTTEEIANPGFSMNGNGLYVQGNAGIKGNAHTQGKFVVKSTTELGEDTGYIGGYTSTSEDYFSIIAKSDSENYFQFTVTDDQPTLHFTSSGMAFQSGFRLNSSTGDMEYRDDGEATWTPFDYIAAGASIWSQTSSYIYPTSTTAEIILGSGNYLGLGITPRYALDVDGDAYIGANLYVSSSDFYIGTDTYLSESTDRLDSGAYFVGVDPTNISSSASTNVQFVLEDLDLAISGISSLWTEGSSYIYPASTTAEVYLASGNWLGIGTSSPTSTLQLYNGDAHFMGGNGTPGLYWDYNGGGASVGYLGLGTTSPSYHVHVSGSRASNPVMYVVNTYNASNTLRESSAITGISTGNRGDSNPYGVYGQVSAYRYVDRTGDYASAGVKGVATASGSVNTPNSIGVFGRGDGDRSFGVMGLQNSATAHGAETYGVFGYNRGTNYLAAGIGGYSASGIAGRFADTYTNYTEIATVQVLAQNSGAKGILAYGTAADTNYLIKAFINNNDDVTAREASEFITRGQRATAIYAEGETNYVSTNQYGIITVHDYTGATAAVGVAIDLDYSAGGYGVHSTVDGIGGYGIYSLVDDINSDAGASYGVYAETQTQQGYGVYGYAQDAAGINYGIYGITNSEDNGWAGYFTGSNTSTKVYIDSTLVFNPMPSAATSTAGSMYFDSDDTWFKGYDGANWWTFTTTTAVNLWTDGGTWIYPNDAGDYGATGMRIYDDGALALDADLVVDGFAGIGAPTSSDWALGVLKTFSGAHSNKIQAGVSSTSIFTGTAGGAYYYTGSLFFDAYWNGTAGATQDAVVGAYGKGTVQGTGGGSLFAAYGSYAAAQVQAGNVSTTYGIYAQSDHIGGLIDTSYGGYFRSNNGSKNYAVAAETDGTAADIAFYVPNGYGDSVFMDNLSIGGMAETLSNAGFATSGDDLFVAGMAGIEGNVYTDGSFIASSTTEFGESAGYGGFASTSAPYFSILPNYDSSNYFRFYSQDSQPIFSFVSSTMTTAYAGFRLNSSTGDLEYRDDNVAAWTPFDNVYGLWTDAGTYIYNSPAGDVNRFYDNGNVAFDQANNTLNIDAANHVVGIRTTPNTNYALRIDNGTKSFGIYQVATSGSGAYFSTATGSYGVQVVGRTYGIHTNITGGSDGYAGFFQNSNTGIGAVAVYGYISDSNALDGYAGYFVNAGHRSIAASGGTGVYGAATNSTGANRGGYFVTNSTYSGANPGTSVYTSGITGVATDAGATTMHYGGNFTATGGKGVGVYAEAISSAGGPNYGGYFSAAGTGSSAAVYGTVTYNTSENYGVYGVTASATGWGGYFDNNGAGASRSLGASHDVYIGQEQPTDDDYLYFDAGNEYLMWDEAPGQFVLSDDLNMLGSDIFVSSSDLFISTSTYLSESTGRLDSGAYFVGVNPTNISQSASTNVQFVLEDLSTAIAGAGSLWTDQGTYIDPNNATGNFRIGDTSGHTGIGASAGVSASYTLSIMETYSSGSASGNQGNVSSTAYFTGTAAGAYNLRGAYFTAAWSGSAGAGSQTVYGLYGKGKVDSVGADQIDENVGLYGEGEVNGGNVSTTVGVAGIADVNAGLVDRAIGGYFWATGSATRNYGVMAVTPGGANDYAFYSDDGSGYSYFGDHVAIEDGVATSTLVLALGDTFSSGAAEGIEGGVSSTVIFTGTSAGGSYRLAGSNFEAIWSGTATTAGIEQVFGGANQAIVTNTGGAAIDQVFGTYSSARVYDGYVSSTYGIYARSEIIGATVLVDDAYGGWFRAQGSNDFSYGVYAEAQDAATQAAGWFRATGGAGDNTYGVYGRALSGDLNVGVYARAENGSTAYGVEAVATGATNNYGVEAVTPGGVGDLAFHVGNGDGDSVFMDNLSIGGYAETLDNAGFATSGDDLFVAGMAGIEGNVYTDGQFIASSTTAFGESASHGGFASTSAPYFAILPNYDSDDYIYFNTDSNLAAIYWEGYYANDPGIRIGATGELEYRDQNESTWTPFGGGTAGWTDRGAYIDPNNATGAFKIRDTNGHTAIGTYATTSDDTILDLRNIWTGGLAGHKAYQGTYASTTFVGDTNGFNLSMYGINNVLTYTGNVGAGTENFYGIRTTVNPNITSGVANNAYGGYFKVDQTIGSLAVQGAYGVYAEANDGANNFGVVGMGISAPAGTGGSHTGGYFYGIGAGVALDVSSYGVYANAQSSATNYGVYAEASGGTNNYAFYSPDAGGYSYFGDHVAISDGTAKDANTVLSIGELWTAGLTGSTTYRGQYTSSTFNANTNDNTLIMYGDSVTVNFKGTASNIGGEILYGQMGLVNSNPLAGTVDAATGGYFSANQSVAGGTHTDMYGLLGSASGWATNAYGGYFLSAGLTNVYGVYAKINASDVGATNYGVYADVISGATNYSFYSKEQGSAFPTYSYFGDHVAIEQGTAADPNTVLSMGEIWSTALTGTTNMYGQYTSTTFNANTNDNVARLYGDVINVNYRGVSGNSAAEFVGGVVANTYANQTSGNTDAVYGGYFAAVQTAGAGTISNMYGLTTAASSVYADAVYGLSAIASTASTTSYGVYALTDADAPTNYGLYAEASGTPGSGTNYGIYAKGSGAPYNFAAYFSNGRVHIEGDDTATAPDYAYTDGDLYVRNQSEFDGGARFDGTGIAINLGTALQDPNATYDIVMSPGDGDGRINIIDNSQNTSLAILNSNGTYEANLYVENHMALGTGSYATNARRVIDATETFTGAGDTYDRWGLYMDVQTNINDADMQLIGVYSDVTVAGQQIGTLIGTKNNVNLNTYDSIVEMKGLVNAVTLDTDGGSTGVNSINLWGIDSKVLINNTTSTVDTAYGARIEVDNSANAGDVSNVYGVYNLFTAKPGSTGNWYGYYFNAVNTPAGNKYAFYSPTDGWDAVFGGDMYIGQGSGADTDYLYFDAGGEYLSWDNNEFRFTDDLRVDYNLSVGDASAADDDYIYFDGGNAYLRWQNSSSSFAFSYPIETFGTYIALNSNGPDTEDISIDFYENGTWWQEQLRWDNGSNAFQLTDDTAIEGALLAGAGADQTPKAYHQFGNGTKDRAEISNLNDVYITADLELDGAGYAASGFSTGDYAENMIVRGGIDYGEVAVADPSNPGDLIRSTETYQSGIVGIYSEQPVWTIGGCPGNETICYPIALAGRTRTKASNENGAISVGDPVTTAETDGYIMKATKPGQIIGIALESLSATTGTVLVSVQPSWSSGNTISFDATSSIFTDNFAFESTGTASSSTPAFDSYGLSFRGSGWNTASSTAEMFEMTMRNAVSSTSTFEYGLEITNDDNAAVAYVSKDGDLMLAGKLYPSDKGVMQRDKYIFLDKNVTFGDYMRTNADGWATGSYDYAEMFKSEQSLIPGELVVVANTEESVKKSAEAYQGGIVGIVSTKPGFIAGEFTTSTYPIALAGRVPTRVTNAGGAIEIGDPVTTSDVPGFGMKALSGGPIVGYALEASDAEFDTIIVYVNPGWYGGEGGTILAGTSSHASQFDPANPDEITYLDNHLVMNGYEIHEVRAIYGANYKWSIDENGQLVNNVETSQGGKDIFGVMSTGAQIVLSGSAALEQGEARLEFSQAVRDIISHTAEIQVTVTPTSGEGNGVYVSDKSWEGFTVSELASGASNATFDWMVVAQRSGYETETSGDAVITTTEEVVDTGTSTTEEIVDTGTSTSTTEEIIGGTESSSTEELVGGGSTSTEPVI